MKRSRTTSKESDRLCGASGTTECDAFVGAGNSNNTEGILRIPFGPAHQAGAQTTTTIYTWAISSSTLDTRGKVARRGAAYHAPDVYTDVFTWSRVRSGTQLFDVPKIFA